MVDSLQYVYVYVNVTAADAHNTIRTRAHARSLAQSVIQRKYSYGERKLNSLKTVALTTACAIYPHLANCNCRWIVCAVCTISFVYLVRLERDYRDRKWTGKKETESKARTTNEKMSSQRYERFTISQGAR